MVMDHDNSESVMRTCMVRLRRSVGLVSRSSHVKEMYCHQFLVSMRR